MVVHTHAAAEAHTIVLHLEVHTITPHTHYCEVRTLAKLQQAAYKCPLSAVCYCMLWIMYLKHVEGIFKTESQVSWSVKNGWPQDSVSLHESTTQRWCPLHASTSQWCYTLQESTPQWCFTLNESTLQWCFILQESTPQWCYTLHASTYLSGATVPLDFVLAIPILCYEICVLLLL